MITTNVLQRTFHIRFGNSTGTVFTVDHGGKQYLITARHVVQGIKSGDFVWIFHDRQWKEVCVSVVGVGAGDVDVAVLSTAVQLSPSFPLEPTQAGLVYGQQTYFLGFPFGWDGGGEHINRGFSMPYVRSGTLSAIMLNSGSKHSGTMLIDAYGNKGFSGGPVVFRDVLDPRGIQADLRVAGIVVRYPPPPSYMLQPIVDQDRNPILDAQGSPFGFVQENPSLVVAMGVGHAINLIEANPVGFELPTA